MLGARGVLINITASSQLGIHDVNEACNLIRAATQNDECQINFGVVLDERMGDKVKITVIATGFQRDRFLKSIAAVRIFRFTAPVMPDAVSTSESAPMEALRDAQEPATEEMAPGNDYSCRRFCANREEWCSRPRKNSLRVSVRLQRASRDDFCNRTAMRSVVRRAFVVVEHFPAIKMGSQLARARACIRTVLHRAL